MGFSPKNEFEKKILDSIAGQEKTEGLISRLVTSSIFVLSGSEVGDNMENFQPLLFNKNGTIMYAVFSHIDRTTGFSEKAPYCIQVKAIEFLKRIPEGSGLVINPGIPEGFEISPDGLRTIVRDFA